MVTSALVNESVLVTKRALIPMISSPDSVTASFPVTFAFSSAGPFTSGVATPGMDVAKNGRT